jgi:hypothetical protein
MNIISPNVVISKLPIFSSVGNIDLPRQAVFSSDAF